MFLISIQVIKVNCTGKPFNVIKCVKYSVTLSQGMLPYISNIGSIFQFNSFYWSHLENLTRTFKLNFHMCLLEHFHCE